MRRVLFILAIVILLGMIVVSTSSLTGFFVFEKTAEPYRCEGCNVVIITIDTLRAGHLTPYGYAQDTSPHLNELAQEGVVFTQAFSQIPHTPPSHWSMFTGLYPFTHNQYGPLDNGSTLTTLSDILTQYGYVTSAFVSSKMVGGFSHEFEYFNGRTNDKRTRQITRKTADQTTKGVKEWLRNHTTDRFFLWIHYFDVHSPYEPPQEHDLYNYTNDPRYAAIQYDKTGISRNRPIRNDIEKYDGEIHFVDDSIQDIRETLKQQGKGEDTLLIVLSDHGECFGEHLFSEFGYQNNDPCLFHGKTLFDEEIHIPLIVYNPHSTVRGLREDSLIESVDLFPTVLDILGIGKPQTDGESLVPLLEGKRRQKDYVVIQTRPRRSGSFAIGIRDNEWKFVTMIPTTLNLEEDIQEQQDNNHTHSHNTEDIGEQIKLLFNVKGGEFTNFYLKKQDIAQRLELLLEDRIAERFVAHPVPQNRDAEKILRSLGYVG